MRRWWLIPICLLFMMPVVWLVKGSFEGAMGLITMPPTLIPRSMTTDNYRLLIEGCRLFGRWAANTALLSLAAGTGAVVVTILAGYAFAQRFPGHMVVFWMMIGSAVIPGMVLIIPRFLTLRVLHLPLGFLAAWLPLLYSPMAVLMCRAWVLQIGKEYIEQARLEGMGEWRIAATIIGPMSKPVIGMVLIFQGVGALQDYMWQALVLRWPEQQTLVVGLMEYLSQSMSPGQPDPAGMRMAMGVMLLIPTIIVFTVGHRWFVGEGKGLEW